MSDNQVMSDSSAIPLLVGVVGHRDLLPQEMPAIRAETLRLLRALREAQPEVRVMLLSAQAEGADLVAADVAQELGIGIVALLPFDEAQCRAELSTGAGRAIFDRTMAGAEKLELSQIAGGADPAQSGESRDRQFERAGDLIAQHSSLLIAIWDGLDTEHRAGTARTIEQRRGADGSFSLTADNDLMYEIRCSRLSNPRQGAGVQVIGFVTGETRLGTVEQGIPPVLKTQLERTAEFNRDLADYGARIATHGAGLAAGSTGTDALGYLDRLFGAADWLAVHFGRSFRRALAIRFSLWALMAYLLLAFKHNPDGVRGFLTISAVLLAFALSWLLAYWARRRSWDRRYLDYRALAEGLRVDFYWEMSGVRAQFDDAFAHEGFLQKQDAQIEWMRAAMRAVNLRCALLPRAAMPDGVERALGAWVGDPDPARGAGQRHYYRQRTVALERRLALAEHISRAMLLAGLALAVSLGVDVALRLFSELPVLAPLPRNMLLTALALLTAYTAIFEIYLAERADRSLVRQYRHMDTLFGNAAQQLGSAGNVADKRGILRALGHACLAEHAQWILAHREKRVDGLRW